MPKNSSQITIEILIATMNRTSLDFLDAMFPNFKLENLNLLIVNQTTENNFLVSNVQSIRVINSLETGLSKSRNLAIQNSIGTILVIADDDVVYENDFLVTIENAHLKYKNAASISFCINNEKGELFKKYPKSESINFNFFQLYNTMSVEITLNKNNFDANKIKFDENFGLKSLFPLGEEQIFLTDLKKQKLEMVFVPKVIASHDSLSSNEKVDFKNLYFSLGGVYSRNQSQKYIKWIFLKLFFDVKQGKIKFTQVFSALKSSFKGRKEFLKISKK